MDSQIRLGDYLFRDIAGNEYLQELYQKLLTSYGLWRIVKFEAVTSAQAMSSRELLDTLRFADLLSKSTHPKDSDAHKNWAQELIVMALALYPDQPFVRKYAATVYSTLTNYPGRQRVNASSFGTALDRAFVAYQDEFLRVPSSDGLHFFAPQKAAFDEIARGNNYSFSAPTSLGKSFIIRSFITSEVKRYGTRNFAILVPSKALINETRASLIRDLKSYLESANYRVVTAAGDIALEGDHNFIFVLTPERLLYLLISRPNIRLDYVFIDEAHKISAETRRAAFYYQVVSILQHRTEPPKFVFSSPNIPNPDEFLKLLVENRNDSSDAIQYSPVVKFTFLADSRTNELMVYNSHTDQSTALCQMGAFSELPDFVAAITGPRVANEDPTQTLVYVNNKQRAAESAVNYARRHKLPDLDDPDLDQLAESIKRDISDDYFLSALVRKGVAYHIGYLPPAIREKLEALYRCGKIRVLFTTSTLLEGVNLPADNLIVTSLRNGPRKLTPVDFKNLTGRVGRIEYNLYGNVFIYLGEVKNEYVSTAEELLSKEVKPEQLSIDALTKNDLHEIVRHLCAGTTLVSGKGHSVEKAALMRKFATILARDLIAGRDTYIIRKFATLLDDDNRAAIIKQFSRDTVEQDDDINISVDQAERVEKHFEQNLAPSTPSPYPTHVFNCGFDYHETLRFLETLASVFDWKRYEPETIGKTNGASARLSLLRWYTVVLVQWMEGRGLRQIMKRAVEYKKTHPDQTVRLNGKAVPFEDSVAHRNIVYNEVLGIIENIILFRLSNYFLRFSNDFKTRTNVSTFPNDWYEYVEYGTDNPETIGLQRLGFSRESARYIRDHPEYFTTDEHGSVLLAEEIFKCENAEVRREAEDIRYNVPEFILQPPESSLW